ncbi:MAG: glycosyltransferase family 39 protein, partial [Bacteroidia bacterium]
MDQAANDRFYTKALFLILGSGLLFKLLYLFLIGPHVFGESLCVSNDTFSYTSSFINLVSTGRYTHNPDYEPAYYGRLPAVSFSWGIFYLIFGLANSYKAFAVFQIALDVLAGVFVFRIIDKFFHKKAALVSTVVYVFFPLTIYFVVKTGVEYLTVFFTIAVFYKLVFYKPTVRNSIALGLLLILGLFVKETLLLLLPIAFIYLFRNYSLKAKYYFIVLLTALCVYVPWPVRNYIRAGSLMLTKPVAAGYLGFKEDMMNYVYWMYSWHDVDMLDYFNAAYNDAAPIAYPKDIFNSPAEEELAHNLIKLGRRCGSSFAYWKKMKGLPPPECNCNNDKLIGRGFDLLRRNYIRTHFFVYYIKVPLQNMARALFKNSLTTPQGNIDILFKIVMGLRSALLLMGIAVCIAYRRHDFFVFNLIFFVVYYIFICAVFRHLEMRYLLP